MNDFKEFACPNCNSELNYDADLICLKCEHCQSKFEIENSNEQIVENCFENAVLNEQSNEASLTTVLYKCHKCGQLNNISNDVVFAECTNCSYNVINTKGYKLKSIHPSAIIPFTISKSAANNIFSKWIAKGFWTESNLKHLSIIENLVGSYIPFWTFDAHTTNEWSGNAGYYYYEEESYTDADGERQTRTIQKTRWEYHEGNFEYFFDDILVCGNNDFAQQEINKIYPYDLSELLPLNEKYIVGWNAKAYSKDIETSFNYAASYIEKVVYNLGSEALGGDVQSGLQVDTSVYDKTYKHIVLPVWICEYLYKGKKYGFIINGQTGKIDGNKPLSTTKIVFAILLALIILAIVAFYYYNQQHVDPINTYY